ncbi:integrase [Pseudomonas nitroreducens]|uniref:integrase n=1 Tax=Pseudomonas nitroreducens TaxID=46680 RepID=UPI002FE40FEA
MVRMTAMSRIFVFKSRAEFAAAENLSDFVSKCRDDIAAFSDKMNWDNWLWPKLASFTVLGTSGRSTDYKDKMREPFIDFAKAYFRYQQGHNPTGAKNEIKALKLVEKVLADVNGVPDILDLTPNILDQACALAREHYSSSAYQAGRELQRLAKFVTAHRLINGSCRDWANPIKRPADNNKIGKKGKELRDKRLPKEDAIMAMAEIFSQGSDDPRDIFTSSVFALLMSAPSRISEVLSLPVDCEIEELDKDGAIRYGLRFHSGKGYAGNIKWVPTPMVSIAKEAIRRLTEITSRGRALAKWIIENPGKIYRHENCPQVGQDVPLSRFQTCAALNLNPADFREAGAKLFQYKFKDVDSVTLSEILSYSMSRMPENFPWVNRDAGVTYANALFSMTANSLHATRGAVPFIPWLPSGDIVNNDLSPRESLGAHNSIFDRFRYVHADGARMKITTHQLRHLLDTMGQRGGLSEDERARWAGRADLKQNRTYSHVTEIEKVEQLERFQLESAFNYGQQLIHHEPVSKAEFELIPKGAAHVTMFGFCVHDYVMSPCGKARDCTNCGEHVCVKKEDERKTRIIERRNDTEAQVDAAREGVSQGLFGADRWLEYHELSLARLNELVNTLNDPDVPDGSLIKLKSENSFSHLQRAIAARKSSAIQTEKSEEVAVVDDLLLLMGGVKIG